MKISVVVPAYNAAHFLPRSLGSVFAQTLKPDEVIVVDDGSTDNTSAVAAELGATVVHRTNGGISAARNTGIRSASGDWIALLDADDCWAPEKLERQVSCIQSDTVVVYTGVRFVDKRGIRGELSAMAPSVAMKVLRYRNPIAQSTTLVKRDALLRLGGYREDISACEDWELWVRLQKIGKFEAVSAPLMDYYLHENNFSGNPKIMLRALSLIIDETLLADLQGLSRWVWRRRINAVQLCSAALIARDNGMDDDLYYMYRSLSAWPSPFWEPQRFAMFAVSLRNWFRQEKAR
jgi:glycosyltransferase involved in cell wall biosynthesis